MEEVAELGGKPVGGREVVRVQEQKRGGDEDSDEAFLECFHVAEFSRLGLDEGDDGLQLAIAHGPSPGALGDGTQDSGGVFR